MAQVIRKRSQLVRNASQTTQTGGRFLLFFPHETLADGAADLSSNGFFDVNYVPPWDIWVGYSDGILVSWVPPVLVDAADFGIGVNPEECIRWA